MIILKCILFVLLICSIGSFFQFVSDVRKWHDREEDVIAIPSNSDNKESEVINDVGDSADLSDAGERDSSTVSFPWSES